MHTLGPLSPVLALQHHQQQQERVLDLLVQILRKDWWGFTNWWFEEERRRQRRAISAENLPSDASMELLESDRKRTERKLQRFILKVEKQVLGTRGRTC